jgi:hypothetical protein
MFRDGCIGVARNDQGLNIIRIRERNCIDDSRTVQPTE